MLILSSPGCPGSNEFILGFTSTSRCRRALNRDRGCGFQVPTLFSLASSATKRLSWDKWCHEIKKMDLNWIANTSPRRIGYSGIAAGSTAKCRESTEAFRPSASNVNPPSTVAKVARLSAAVSEMNLCGPALAAADPASCIRCFRLSRLGPLSPTRKLVDGFPPREKDVQVSLPRERRRGTSQRARARSRLRIGLL